MWMQLPATQLMVGWSSRSKFYHRYFLWCSHVGSLSSRGLFKPWSEQSRYESNHGHCGAESLSAAGNIFVGQTESPLIINPASMR